MKLPTLTIHSKIVFPFTLLFVVVTTVIALVSMSVIATHLQRRALQQIEHASEMITHTDFALNPVILANVRSIVEVDIVTYRRDGQVIASTLSSPTAQTFLRLIQAPEVTEQLFTQGQQLVLRDLNYLGTPHKIAYRPLRVLPDTLVAFVVATSYITQAQRDIARVIGLVAVAVIVVMFFVSQVIAGSITSPVQRLVDFTRTLAAGDLTQHVEVHSRDEIGKLAVAFNDMVQRLRQSEARLVQSEKLAVAGQLAAGIAHDIRNPLSSLKLFVQMLRSRRDRDQDTLQIMLREIERVEWVVKGLLDLVRPGELHLAPGQINDVVCDTLRLTEAQLVHRKIAITQQLDNALPPVRLDADRLTQAVLNLVLNAAEAMPDGGALRLATRLDGSGTMVTLEICDDGAGIAEESRDKVFEPFFSTKREGVGLGLMNARNIVERHGGTLRLMARDGGGTCAVITLPADGQGRYSP